MAAASFGATVLDKHGRGKLAPENKNELQADLKKELLATAGADNIAIKPEILDKEISRFLEFGYASESNLDRLRRRVMRLHPGGSRASDVASVRSVGSIAYSQPPSRQAGDSESKLLFSITEGMKSHTENFKESLKVQSARGPRSSDPDRVATPGSARLSVSAAGSSVAGNGCKWSTVAKLNALRESKDAEMAKATTKAKQMKLKEYLDQQVEAKGGSKAQKSDETRRLRNLVDHDFQRLQEEEERKKVEFQKKVQVLKADREDQIITARAAHEHDRREMLEAGKKLAEQANRALEMEQKAALEKKNAEKKLMAKLMVEWNEEKEHHLVEQKLAHTAEREAVLRLQEEIRLEEEKKQAVIRKELQERDKQFQQLAEAEANARQEKKIKREARITEENRQLEAVNKANAEATEKERLKKLQQKADRVKNVEFLFQQMSEQRTKKQAEVEAKTQLLDQAKSTLEKYSDEEKKKAAEMRRRNEQHRFELENQISSRRQLPSTVREDLMSTSEAFINKNLVAEAGQVGLF